MGTVFRWNLLTTCSELKPSYLGARRRKPEDANIYDLRPTTAILYFQTQADRTKGVGDSGSYQGSNPNRKGEVHPRTGHEDTEGE